MGPLYIANYTGKPDLFDNVNKRGAQVKKYLEIAAVAVAAVYAVNFVKTKFFK